MKLYYTRYTRASRPRWVLEELGVPYELVRVDMTAGEHKAPSYLSIHPHGQVPALVDGDVTVFESSAICLYLAEKHPEAGLVPGFGAPDRPAFLQWMAYLTATLEPTIAQYNQHVRGTPEDRRVPFLAEDAMGKLRQQAAVLNAALNGREWLCGSFTVADILLASLLAWAKSLGMLKEQPALTQYLARAQARPAWRRASAD